MGKHMLNTGHALVVKGNHERNAMKGLMVPLLLTLLFPLTAWSQQNLPKSFFNYSTHAFSVAEAIELARVLDRLPPGLIVYAVEGKNFGTGASLSAEVERATEKICQKITAEILSNLEISAEKRKIKKF